MPTETRSPLVLSSREVADLAGVTYRQLDYWCRTDLLTPSVSEARGSGSCRRFSLADAYATAALGRLASLGAADFTKLQPLAERLMAMAPDDFRGLLFVTADGIVHRVFPEAEPAAFVLDLDAIVRRFELALEAAA